MQENIKSFNREIDSIKLVLNKLITKQNSPVFDKLCNMVRKLFNRMTDYNASELTQNDIQELIASFKRLLEIAITLFNYREYLIAVVNQNISELETMQQNTNNGNIVNMPQANKLDTVVTPAVDEVQEVGVESLNNVVSLNLTNNDQKNAA